MMTYYFTSDTQQNYPPAEMVSPHMWSQLCVGSSSYKSELAVVFMQHTHTRQVKGNLLSAADGVRGAHVLLRSLLSRSGRSRTRR